MKILYLTPASSTTSMAIKLQEEGNTVYHWFPDKGNTAEGILKDKIKDWKPYASKSDLIIVDDVMNDLQKEVWKLKKPAVCGNSLFDKLENDRLFGKLGFQKAGLTTSDCIQFNDFKKAMEFVKQNPGRWVFKANGQAARTLGFVAKEESGKDMLERLAFYETHMKNNKQLWDKKLGVDFVLERAVDGIEVACGGYWDGTDFSAVNINWEHKRLGVGNVGVATGEMGTVVHELSRSSKFYHSTIEKLIPYLKQTKYRTYIDLNCIVDEHNASIIEATSRIGYPIEAVLDQMSALKTTERYAYLAAGTLHKKNYWKHPWGISVVCGTFGFPYNTAYDEFGASQPFDFDKKDSKQVYLDDVALQNHHMMTSNSGEGWICTVAQGDDTLSGAKEKAYAIVDRLSLPGIMYRKDIGDKVPDHLDQLKKWGWV